MTTDSFGRFTGGPSPTFRFYSTSTTLHQSAAPTPDELLAQYGSTNTIGNSISTALYALATADCVCFDVDSTVLTEEGIDVLADYLGQGEAVAALTKQAMEGGLAFQEALAQRLDLLQPSKSSIEGCLRDHPLQLSPGIRKLVNALQESGKDVYLVSGGFRIMIEPVAVELDIPFSNIYANTLFFDDVTGDFKGFDATEPTSADMGKPKALEEIQQAKGYKTMVMVGDGATDAQAKPPAKAFIGFGGVVRREAVVRLADWFVTDFETMTAIVREHGKSS